jgi:hypothetical protein
MNNITSFCRIRDMQVISGEGVTKFHAESIDGFSGMLYESVRLEYPKFYRMDMQSRLGFLASEILLKSASLQGREITALVLSNAAGSTDTDIRFNTSIQTMASPALFVYTLPNIVAGEICIRHSLKGENAFFVTHEFDTRLMADYVDLLLEDMGAHDCIAGWVNVIGEQHDVLLYLVQKGLPHPGIPHRADEIEKLYRK